MPARSGLRRRQTRKLTQRIKQSIVESEERRTQDCKSLCYKGNAVVRLSELSAGKARWRLIDDGQNSNRIIRLLQVQGCLRLDKKFHVPVVVDSTHWQSQVFFQEPTLAPDLGLPQLGSIPGYAFIPLDRKSLIIAAEKYFEQVDIADPWWIVEVYVSEANNDIATQNEAFRTIKESYTNDKRPSDGRIYRSIRLYQGIFTGVHNKVAESYWWAVLGAESGSRKPSYLRALCPTIRNALDSLLPIAGIWEGMRIGVLHKINAMKCEEPICCYLEHIRRTFMYIVADDRSLLAGIDAVTVKIIQSRAPATSFEDLRYLEREWEKGNLFQFMRFQDRELAWRRLRDIPFIIPTLATFFQDVLFLDVTQTVIRKLCLSPPEGAGSIDKVILSQYVGQLNASDSTLLESESIRQQLLDLWRFSFQYAFELSGKKDHHRRVPRKAEDIERAVRLDPDRESQLDSALLLCQFSSLAYNYGFEVPTHIHFNEPETLPDRPSYFPPHSLDDVDVERRCGKPFTDSIVADRFALSRSSLFQAWIDPRVSTGFVRRCVFFSFFSYLSADIDHFGGFQNTVGQNGTELSAHDMPISTSPVENPPIPLVVDIETEFLETFGDMPWDIDQTDS